MNSINSEKDDRAKLKQVVCEKIALADEDGKYTDSQYDDIIENINQLVKLTPIPEPINEQKRIEGPWLSLFASFGPRHTAGKPIQHETFMSLLTFNKLPKAPIKILEISQEIEASTQAYNNVTKIRSVDGSMDAELVIYGKYKGGSENLMRYTVDFYRVAIVGEKNISDEELRKGLGLEADQPLEVDFKPPVLHSDIVFCDEDMRINFGSLGGIYVMERMYHSGRSVTFGDP